MLSRPRPVLIPAALVLLLSACQNQQPTAVVDTSLKEASDSQLHSRIQSTCIGTQEHLAAISYDEIWPRCECYATRTMKALSKPEKDALRETNVFNETARAKALEAVDACKLKRPAGL